jgi:hypothetical protein
MTEAIVDTIDTVDQHVVIVGSKRLRKKDRIQELKSFSFFLESANETGLCESINNDNFQKHPPNHLSAQCFPFGLNHILNSFCEVSIEALMYSCPRLQNQKAHNVSI